VIDIENTLLVAVVKNLNTTISAELWTVANSRPNTAIAATLPITRYLRSNRFNSGIDSTDPIGSRCKTAR
jgi:hypothetical protein